MCNSKMDGGGSSGLPAGRAANTEGSANPEAEESLREEIAFWNSYIDYCRDSNELPVPDIAHEALVLAKRKLQRFLAVGNLRPGSSTMH
ncbi:hypothetical protein [Thiolapillus sp.]